MGIASSLAPRNDRVQSCYRGDNTNETTRRACSGGRQLVSAKLPRPAIAQAAAKTLKFIPEGNLQNPDPIWSTTTVARNFGYMIWDTLYGWDGSLAPKPQMAEGHAIEDGGLTWRFRLRDGLKFHDGIAGARGGLRRIDPALDEARRLRAAHRGLAERTRRHRRPQLRVPPEEAVPAARARPRQAHRQCLLHHAGADREDRTLQADRRIHRLRSLRVQSQRMDPGCARHVQALRRLRAAAGAAELRRRRQAGELRAHRVEHHHRRRHVFRRHPVGRGGVVADAHRRSAAAAAQGARRGGGAARRFRRRRLHALQHAASAVRQREAAPRSAAGDQSGGFHERRDGRRSGDQPHRRRRVHAWLAARQHRGPGDADRPARSGAGKEAGGGKRLRMARRSCSSRPPTIRC